jgi:hypothetical protein
VTAAHSIVKAVVPSNVRYAARLQWRHLRTHGFASAVRWNAMWTMASIRNLVGRRRYTRLSEGELRAARRSDTVFIFGSGASLNDLSTAEWSHFARHDVFGFNLFYYARWIPVGFHLLRGTYYGDLRWQTYANEVAAEIRTNPCFAETIVILQEEYTAELGNTLIGSGVLPTRNRIFRYRTARADGLPTHSFREGLRHTAGTLTDAVNCAYLLGWKHIVLVGVDLYDSRYFFLPADQTLGQDPATGTTIGVERNAWRGQTAAEPHNTARIGIIELMAQWRPALASEGIGLSVYNPRSLLAQVLPVYAGPTRSVTHG